MKLLKAGDLFPLTLKLYDSKSNRFIRAKLYSTSMVLLGTYDLNHVLNGFYALNLSSIPNGNYHVFYEVFKDSGYTQKDSNYSDAEEFFSVRDIEGTVQAGLDQISSKIDDGDGQIAYST